MRPRLRIVAALLLASFAAAAPAAAVCPATITGSGIATHYDYTGGQCSYPVVPGEYIAAIPTPEWDGSAPCGRCLEVTGPTATIVVKVVDQCTTCSSAILDLNLDAFDAIKGANPDIVDIVYHSVPCPYTDPYVMHWSSGSNPYFLQIQLRDARYGVVSAKMLQQGGDILWPRTTDNWFQYVPSPMAAQFPMTLRFTDVHGDSLDETLTSVVAGGDVVGTQQFPDPPCLTVDVPGEELRGLPAPVAAPNPFVGQTRLLFSVQAPERVTVDVFDLGGRRVRRLFQGMMEPGRQDVAWDGRDAGGSRVPAGIYLVKMAGKAGESEMRVVRER